MIKIVYSLQMNAKVSGFGLILMDKILSSRTKQLKVYREGDI